MSTTTHTGVRPGWYPDPSGAAGQRYWDGVHWTYARTGPPPKTASKTWIIWVLAGFAVLWLGVGVVLTLQDLRPVRSVHSDDPGMEAFYRELDSIGLGNMRVGDANDRAKEVCDHGDGLILWGVGDYSMADSFRFGTASLHACDALGE